MYSFNKYLLIISKDYWETTSSENTASLFSNKLGNLLGIPSQNITHLIGNIVNINTVKQQLYDYIYISLLNNTYKPTLYIYMNGHGNQTIDSNGDEIIEINAEETDKDIYDEMYQLPDGNLVDDEFTSIIDNAIYNSNCIERPTVILFSDHCCSGSMIDNTSKYFDWVSFGSSKDNQDSYVSGDGNVMTINLLQVLEQHKTSLNNINSCDFYKLLDMEMKGSFIGEIQECTFHISDNDMLYYKLFS